MVKRYLSQHNGYMFVLFAITLPFLMIAGFLVVDMGYAYVTKAAMQNAADAAALAGAAQLSKSNDVANQAAVYYVQRNSPDGTTVTMANSDNFPDAEHTISVRPLVNYHFTDTDTVKTLRVELRQQVPLFFLKYFSNLTGYTAMPVGVVATAQSTNSQTDGFGDLFDYAIFGCQSIYFWSNGMTINGSIRVNDSIFMYANNSATLSNGGVVVTNPNTTWTQGWSNGQQIYFTVGSGTGYQGVTSESSKDISVSANSAISQYIQSIANMSASDRASQHIFYDISGTEFDSYTNTVNGYTGITNQYQNTYTVIITSGTIQANTIDKTMSKNLILISLNGDIHFQNNVPTTAFIYAPKGNIYIDGNGTTVTGSIVGQNVYLSTQNQSIVYANPGSSGNGSSSGKTVKLIDD